MVIGATVAGNALSQETIPTARGAGAPATAPSDPTPLKLAGHPAYDDRGPPPPNPCAMLGLGPDDDADPPPAAPATTADGTASGGVDHRVHGEVFAGVGTGGYREAGVTACAPLGDHAAVALSVEAARNGH